MGYVPQPNKDKWKALLDELEEANSNIVRELLPLVNMSLGSHASKKLGIVSANIAKQGECIAELQRIAGYHTRQSKARMNNNHGMIDG